MGNVLTNSIIDKFTKLAPETKKFIKHIELVLEPTLQDPFSYLCRAINFQQISGKAAAAIHGRFEDLVGELIPDNIRHYKLNELRSVGLSRQKASYILNIAEAFYDKDLLGKLTTINSLKELSSQEIIDHFSSVKGVGEWTVQMYLLFSLGRMDVFAANDLAVRKGVQKIFELPDLPTPGESKKLTKHWSPYQSVGTILSYRIFNLENI